MIGQIGRKVMVTRTYRRQVSGEWRRWVEVPTDPAVGILVGFRRRFDGKVVSDRRGRPKWLPRSSYMVALVATSEAQMVAVPTAELHSQNSKPVPAPTSATQATLF